MDNKPAHRFFNDLLPFLLTVLIVAGCHGDFGGGDDEGASYDRTSAPGGQIQAVCTATVKGTGSVNVENDYLARVITCEHGGAPDEALRAQAVAARTFLYWKIMKYGQIGDGQNDQVYTCNRAPQARHHAAVAATSGQVLLYAGKPICSFYVAGSKGDPNNQCRGQGGATEHYVTYNAGLSGNNLNQSTIGWISLTNTYNRGCMSQLGSDCLDGKGYKYLDILRFYYGKDIQLITASGSCVKPGSLPPGAAPSGTPPPAPADPLMSACKTYGWISTCQGTTLLQCTAATQKAVKVSCPAGCKVNAVGTADTCNSQPTPPRGGTSWSCNKSSYLGAQVWTCSGGARYRCTNNVPVKELCHRGCHANSLGQDDQCIVGDSAWSCKKSSHGGKQLWTCSGASLFSCDAAGPRAVHCPKGCNHNPLGTHDTCK